MTIELAHDVIALKIWEQLPEQDKQLRLVGNSLEQRLKDFKKGDGSYLGEKELLAWEDFFPLLKLSQEQNKFVKESKLSIKAQKIEDQEQRDRELKLTQQKLSLERRTRRRQRVYLGLLSVFTILSTILSVYAFKQSAEAEKSKKVALEKQKYAELSASAMGTVIQDMAQKKSEDLLASIERALEIPDFDLVVAEATSILNSIEKNQEEIDDITEGPEILESFDKVMQPYIDSSKYYINKYQPIVDNGTGELYEIKMREIKSAINNKAFDRALMLQKEAEQLELILPNLKKDLAKMKPLIHQQAFDHHFRIAKNGFENSHSKIGKFIDPYDQIIKMEEYHLANNKEVLNNWFKGTYCDNVKKIPGEELSKYPKIRDIYNQCNN